MKIIKMGRREGKTTKGFEILNECEKSIFICTTGMRASQLCHEYPQFKGKIVSSFSSAFLRGRDIELAIIDDSDNLPTSKLIELINSLQERNIRIVITTTD